MALKKPAPKPAAPARKPLPPATTAVVRREERAVTSHGGLSDEDLLKDARGGMESMTKDDLAIPRLGIIQTKCPQTEKNGPQFIEGAEAGDIFENVSNRLFDGNAGVLLVLVSFTHSDIEWIPRKKGGGFVANHGAGSGILSRCKKDPDTFANILPSGNEIVPTAEYFCFLVDEQTGDVEQFMLSLAKSNLAEARRLNTVASSYHIELSNGKRIVPALFYRAYRFKTVPKKNDQGDWMGWKFEEGPDVMKLFPETGRGKEIYQAAVSFRDAVQMGKVKVADPSAEGGASRTTDESAPM